MEQFTCSLCHGKEASHCFSAFDFDRSVEQFELVKCRACGLAITQPVPDISSMNSYYPGAYYGSGKKKFSSVIELLTVLGNKLRARKILKEIALARSDDGASKVLDIGCGRANLLRSLKDAGCECYGIERTRYSDDSHSDEIEIFKGSIAERVYSDGFFDAVIIWHVLEHLHDPIETLDDVARITKKGGLIGIAVPNFSSFQSSLFKADWFHLDLPRHLYHFGTENLSRVLEQRGYAISSVSTSSLEQNLFGFIQSLMNKLKFLGKPNEFYQLLKKRSGTGQTLELVLWLIIAMLILPLALIEFVIALITGKGAIAIVYAHKT